jgi:hypothetical protein
LSISRFNSTKADSISSLDIFPIQHKEPLRVLFANPSEENEIYFLSVKEITKAQKADQCLQKQEDNTTQLFENTWVLCKDDKLAKSFQNRAAGWYHLHGRNTNSCNQLDQDVSNSPISFQKLPILSNEQKT